MPQPSPARSTVFRFGHQFAPARRRPDSNSRLLPDPSPEIRANPGPAAPLWFYQNGCFHNVLIKYRPASEHNVLHAISSCSFRIMARRTSLARSAVEEEAVLGTV